MLERENLLGRWRGEFDTYGISKAAKKPFMDAVNLPAVLAAKRSEFADNKHLSPTGISSGISDFARGKAPVVATGRAAVAAANDALAKQRKSIVPAIKDKTSVLGFLQRQAYRDIFGAVAPARVIEIARDATDPTILESIFESRILLPNLTDEHIRDILKILTDRLPDETKKAFTDQGDAIELLQTAVNAAAVSLGEAVGVAPANFDRWLTETVPPDSKVVVSAVTEFNSEVVTQSALSLPLEQRHALIDTLLATNTAEVLR